MNKLTIILTLFALTISVNGQYSIPTKKKIPESVKIMTVFIGSIVLDAVGDALYDEGKATNNNNKIVYGHVFSAASTGLLLASPFILNIDKKKWPVYFAGYIGFRIALFDPIYNVTRNLPVDYIGSTSYWDKGLQGFNPPAGLQMFGRAVIFTFAITLTINEL